MWFSKKNFRAGGAFNSTLLLHLFCLNDLCICSYFRECVMCIKTKDFLPNPLGLPPLIFLVLQLLPSLCAFRGHSCSAETTRVFILTTENIFIVQSS